jgi:hypothetical protein
LKELWLHISSDERRRAEDKRFGSDPSVRAVLLIGSAPDALRAKEFDLRNVSDVVAINNAWRVRPDWTFLLHAGDFPEERLPVPGKGQTVLSHEAYVPANNHYGGIVYAGGTMAFTAAYWVLHALKPGIMAFCGCDMLYDAEKGNTHFYGCGEPDPLRPDPTLQILEAKSRRLFLLAAREACLCVNVSELPASHLTFPRIAARELSSPLSGIRENGLALARDTFDPEITSAALKREAELGCIVSDGSYWNQMDRLAPDELLRIDKLWLATERCNADHGTANTLSVVS